MFSRDKIYRYSLFRKKIGMSAGPIVVCIGMNPSTASDQVDDPTVRWEQNYAFIQLKANMYTKLNVFDYRSTDPKGMIEFGPARRSPKNLDEIEWYARNCKTIICSWGKLPKELHYGPSDVLTILKHYKREPMCWGMNNDGSPKHPLYLKRDTPLIPYNPGDLYG